MKRCIILMMDSFGIGAASDAAAFGDSGADTLGHIVEWYGKHHRKLGKELGLFTFMDEGPGFPFFLPNGMVLKNQLIDYWREIHKKAGYVEISTPIMLNQDLW